MATILALHHKHKKLVKPFTPHVIACSVKNAFDQLICRTKEQKASLQCLASAMQSVMPSGANNGKVSRRESARIWQC